MQSCILGGKIATRFCRYYMAAHKCAVYWPASHAKNTCYPSTGCENFYPSQINAYCKAFLREEGGTRMRDGRSLRHLHFFACFITITFPKLRTLPQSPTAPAPSRREPFTRHILPLSLVRFSSPAIASFEPRHYGVVFCYKKGATALCDSLMLILFFRFFLFFA